MEIHIHRELSKILPDFHVYAYTMDVRLAECNELIEHIKNKMTSIQDEYRLEDVLEIPAIKEGRCSYKRLGKDPSRYRLATESLFRRIVKGRGLFFINNVVDCGNLLSLELARSTAVLDLDKLAGDVEIRIGNSCDEYYGIGRGLLNVSSIPLYCDMKGPFGSPTSDTLRTAITSATKKILLMIICFAYRDEEEIEDISLSLFKKYCFAKNINRIKVIKD